MGNAIGFGGAGSAADKIDGVDGMQSGSSPGGGGGGAAGRIRINTTAGQANVTTGTLSPSAQTICVSFGELNP